MLIIDFVGQNFRGMMASLQKKYGFQMPQDRIEYYVKQEENGVITKLETKAAPCDGSMEVLDRLYQEQKYGLGVVSSSAIRRIRASLDKTGQAKYFPHDHVFSAASSLPKPTSKPNPAVYIHAMQTIGVKPEDCVTVEDSKSGATSAVRANIPCIAYVGAYLTRMERDQVAKTLTEVGCKVVMYHWSEFFDCLKKIQEL